MDSLIEYNSGLKIQRFNTDHVTIAILNYRYKITQYTIMSLFLQAEICVLCNFMMVSFKLEKLSKVAVECYI